MRELHGLLKAWQNEHRQRFLSVSVQADHGMFCCIALTNPIEVVICNGSGGDEVEVNRGKLYVNSFGA
jgi:hypothetical protein